MKYYFTDDEAFALVSALEMAMEQFRTEVDSGELNLDEPNNSRAQVYDTMTKLYDRLLA